MLYTNRIISDQSPKSPEPDSLNFAVEGGFYGHKSLQSLIAWRFEAMGAKLFKAFTDCGSVLWFDKYKHRANAEIKTRLDSANFCKNRFCAMCNWRKARKLFKQTYNALKLVKSENPSYRYLFVTFTMQNPPLESTKTALKTMNEAWSRLIRFKRVKTILRGWSRSTELTIQKTDNRFTHPHFHAIWIVSASYFSHGYIKQDELTAMWQQALQVDYKPIVHVEVIKPKNEAKDELASSASEAMKYAVKTTDISMLGIEAFESLFAQLKGLRMVAFGGCLAQARRTLKQDDVENGDLTDEKLDPTLWRLIERLTYIYADSYVLHRREICDNADNETR